jgi:hypothetical protein
MPNTIYFRSAYFRSAYSHSARLRSAYFRSAYSHSIIKTPVPHVVSRPFDLRLQLFSASPEPPKIA